MRTGATRARRRWRGPALSKCPPPFRKSGSATYRTVITRASATAAETKVKRTEIVARSVPARRRTESSATQEVSEKV